MENQAAGAGYIISFFTDIENLTTYFASYKNHLTRLKAKYAKGEKPGEARLDKMDDGERMRSEELTESIRFYIIRTYVKFSAIKNQIKEFQAQAKKLDELFSKLKNDASPLEDTVQDYVIELNSVFVLGIASTVLIKARQVYEEFMGKQ